MGFLDKIAFWKKKDDFSDIGMGDKALGSDLGGGFPSADTGLSTGMETGLPTQPTAPIPPAQAPYQEQSTFQQPSPQPFQQQFQAPPPQQDSMVEKDFELISSKLDALRATLDSINQRLTNIESIARGEEEHHKKKYYRY